MSEKAGDNFEKGIFWELYQDLERQFQDFLEYVPYLSGNETVYSFKLLNLILSIGGYVDSAFKEMARYAKFSENQECQEILRILKKSEERKKKGKAPITVPISLPLKAFEKEYKLSERKVIFKRLPEREDVTPFKPFNPETNAPEWWEIYNGLKHDVGVNIEKANLQITRDALAAAFLLNVRHTPSAVRLLSYGVIKFSITPYRGFGEIKPSFDMSPQNFQIILERKQKYPGFAETQVFIYDYSE